MLANVCRPRNHCFESGRRLPGNRIKRMKPLTAKILVLSVALSCSALLLASAQTTADQDIKKKEAELERQKLDLEKKSLELKRKELDLEKAKQELQYQETGRSMSMNLAGDVLFDYNKAELKPAAEDALQKVAVVLSLFPESNVTIEGYTDAKGGPSVNLQLSRERATSVKNWLVKNGGVAPKHIVAKGFGEANPVRPTRTRTEATTSPDGPRIAASRSLSTNRSRRPHPDPTLFLLPFSARLALLAAKEINTP
jgi:outer membrane protein OmpA-like peptidoglycan-associated protein